MGDVKSDPAHRSRTEASLMTEAQQAVHSLSGILTQQFVSGGIHIRPDTRMLLYALAMSVVPVTIVETGYDAGVTTEALALTGAQVLAIDDLSQYVHSDGPARERLAPYPNVSLIKRDALEFLRAQADASICFAYIDDCHKVDYTRDEAIELCRVLRPGGLAAFHDTVVCSLWSVIQPVFGNWQRINFQAFPREGSLAGNGEPYEQRTDFGLGVVKKP